MFFRSRSPLETREKTWTEFRMQFLANELGIERLTAATVVLPTEEFFPGEFGETLSDVRQYGQILCQHLGVKGQVKYETGDPQLVGAPARLVRDQATILIAENELRDPVLLVSAMAHELSRYRLLEERRMTGEESDFESVVDLFPVYCGLGAFSANATSHEISPDMQRRTGYLPSRVLGYALALFVWARGEHPPVWLEYLRDDARHVMTKGIKYLSKTNDSVFEPTVAPDKRRWSVGQSLERVRAKSPSQRLAALWYLKVHGDFSKSVSSAVQRCLRDSDVAVRRSSAALIPQLAEPDANLQDDLLDAVRDTDAEVRAHAAFAIGEKGFSGPDVECGLEPLLNDPNRNVLANTATTLARMGVTDELVIDKLGRRFKTALVECNYGFAQLLAEPIGQMHGDIHEFAKSFFAHDPELMRQAQEVLAEMDQQPAERKRRSDALRTD